MHHQGSRRTERARDSSWPRCADVLARGLESSASISIESRGLSTDNRVGNGAVLLALYRRIIRPFTPAHTREKLAVHGKVDSIDEWLRQAEAGTVETQMSEDA